VLAGTLQMHEKTGKLWVLKKKTTTVGFAICYMDGPDDKFPSFKELEEKHFPAALIDGNALLPKSVTEKQLFSPLGENKNKDTLISTFQINFIRGGLILGLAVHHSCSDGPGCDGFLSQWAENSKALAASSPLPSLDQANLDRSKLSAPSNPGPVEMEYLSKKLPVFKHVKDAPAPLPAGWAMPPLSPVMYHFSKSSCEKLKAMCKPADTMSWISTYDAIMSIMWKTMTRAKIPYLKPEPTKEVILVHAVNNRSRLDPPLPDRFLGNAVALARCQPMAVESLIAPNNLPDIAVSVRASIKRIDSQSIKDTASWVAGTEDKNWIAMALDSFLGMDLAGTSWQTMKYESKDFGFGNPKAMRFPSPAFDGYVFVYPQRLSSSDPDEGIEICVCLEQSCQERLMLDEELKEFAQPRGL
jgi:hypothetical protein